MPERSANAPAEKPTHTPRQAELIRQANAEVKRLQGMRNLGRKVVVRLVHPEERRLDGEKRWGTGEIGAVQRFVRAQLKGFAGEIVIEQLTAEEQTIANTLDDGEEAPNATGDTGPNATLKTTTDVPPVSMTPAVNPEPKKPEAADVAARILRDRNKPRPPQ